MRAPCIVWVSIAACTLPLGGADVARRSEAKRDLLAEHMSIDADGALALRVGHETVRVRTTSLVRGGVSVASAAEERFEPRGDAAEQTWRFASVPEGAGDLVVRVGVDDLTYVGVETCGARYVSEATGNGICYGRATWVDARGARTQVPWAIDAKGIGIHVPTEVLEKSAYPAVLDPVISPEISVGELAPGPSYGAETIEDDAVGGGRWAVLYAANVAGLNERSEVALFDEQGAHVATVVLPISADLAVATDSIVFDGAEFRAFLSGEAGISMARITTDGEVAGVEVVLPRTGPGERLVVLDAAMRADGTSLVLMQQDDVGVVLVALEETGAVAEGPVVVGANLRAALESSAEGVRLLVQGAQSAGVADATLPLAELVVEPVDLTYFDLKPLVRGDGRRWSAYWPAGADGVRLAEVDERFELVGAPRELGGAYGYGLFERPGGMILDVGFAHHVLDSEGSRSRAWTTTTARTWGCRASGSRSTTPCFA